MMCSDHSKKAPLIVILAYLVLRDCFSHVKMLAFDPASMAAKHDLTTNVHSSATPCDCGDERKKLRPIRISEPALSFNLTGHTKIIGMSSYGYRNVSQLWYDRLAFLGYTTHYVIAVDQEMVDHLQSKNDANGCNSTSIESMNRPECTRFDTMIVKPEGNFRMTMFTVRWRYILDNLKKGIHILQSDVDAIFNRYVPMSIFEDDPFRPDVLAAYSTGFPYDLLRTYGFTFTCGLTWWRSTQKSIQAMEMFFKRCGNVCNDQITWNKVLHEDLDMDWEWDPRVNNTRNRRYRNHHVAFDPVSGNRTTYYTRYVGKSGGNPDAGGLRDVLPGISRAVGLRFRVWSRDFAWRGRDGVKGICPDLSTNWVAMPNTFGDETNEKHAERRARQYRTWPKVCSGYPDDNGRAG